MRKIASDGTRPCDSCDTMFALGDFTAGGNTLFAKNSDGAAHEAQPLD